MKFYKHPVSEFYGGPADGRVIRLSSILGVSHCVFVQGHSYRLFCQLPDRNVYLSPTDPELEQMWSHKADRCVLYTMWRDSSDIVLWRGSAAHDNLRNTFLMSMAVMIERKQRAKKRRRRK